MKIDVKNAGSMEVKIDKIREKTGVEFYNFRVDNKGKSKIEEVCIEFRFPSAGACSVWNSGYCFVRTIEPEWRLNTVASRISSGAPIQQIISSEGNNVLSVSVLDVKTPVKIKTGIIEETTDILCRINFFTMPTSPFEVYETQIRIDTSHLPYEKALKNVRDWWRENGGYNETFVPEIAKVPVYSTWYSFHQRLNAKKLLEQCNYAKKLGMEMIIVDDGWQTEDNGRGYAYCGDWEVADSKIADMRSFVDNVHGCGMKIMLWFSVPFIGKHSKAFKQFEGKIIDIKKEGYGCIDIRYPECREYLLDIYKKAVSEWDLDGLKLDFIDWFMYPENDKPNEMRSTESMEDALQMLLLEIKGELTKIKSDICFEFRQTYVGPAVASVGNMFRVGDCPADMIKNRSGSADIRFIAGKIPVHSDMLAWSTADSAENAALQIINSIFCVPQISVRINELPPKQYAMLKNYISFWNANKKVLLEGDFKAKNPEANYSILSTELNGEIIAAMYSEKLIKVEQKYSRICLINGTGTEGLYADFAFNGEYEYSIKDCEGNIVSSGKLSAKEFKYFGVPKSGIAELRLCED